RTKTRERHDSLVRLFSSARSGRDVRRVRELPVLEAEVDLGLVEHELLPLRGGQVDAVGVDVLDRVADPHVPGLLRDLVVDSLAELVLVRRLGEARQLLAELLALDETGFTHGDGPFTRAASRAPAAHP